MPTSSRDRKHGWSCPRRFPPESYCVCSTLVETLTPTETSQRIAELRAEHRSLDERITRLAANLDDELEAKRLKKRKLQLKDCIAKLESRLIPDEPA